MLAYKVCVVLVGCVLASHAASWRSCSCGYHPCGLDSGESMCSSSSSSKFCEPLVVRPQEVPKPAIQTSLTPIPGPCACKKAIVKPAILPKPVCQPGYASPAGIGSLMGISTSNSQSSLTSSTLSALVGGLGGSPVIYDSVSNPAVLAPADAVSIAIAQQNAQQLCALDEDRLAFGFRKIPVELPKAKIIRQNNIPEEKIFSLNGQIVELKPVKVCHTTKTLDEEAVEDLLALQEEETAAAVVDEATAPIKRISLAELGYVPAKIQDKTFIDVPSGDVANAAGAVAGALAGAVKGVVGGAVAGAVENAVEGAASAAAEALNLSGFRSGNVVYKTVTKPSASGGIVTADDTADCESHEAGEEQSVVYEERIPYGYQAAPYGYSVGSCTCAGPCNCAYQTTSSSSSSSSSKFKKASVTIQKLCTRE